jgi:hypothetical protein
VVPLQAVRAERLTGFANIIPTVLVQLAIGLLQLAFFASVAWMLLKENRKDLNGLGAKVNRMEKSADERYLAVSLALLVAAGPPEEWRAARKKEVLELLRPKKS